jgi:hypothetical protein
MDVALLVVDALVLIGVGMNTVLNWHIYFNKDK